MCSSDLFPSHDRKSLTYKNSDGYWEEYTRDENGNLLTYKNSEGDWSEYTYDQHGNALTFKNSYGYWYEYTRDELIIEDSMDNQ